MQKANIKGTVLIIDNTMATIDMVKTDLINNNYHVLVATNGIKGIESAKIDIPDLILLGTLMPEMDGYETCKQLKKIVKTKQIPIVFMLDLSDVFYKKTIFNIGAVDYVAKPIQREELLSRVNTQIMLSQLQKQLKESYALLEEKVENELHTKNIELEKRNELLKETERKLQKINIELNENNNKLKQSELRLNDAQKIAKIGHYKVSFITGLFTSSEELDRIFGIDSDYTRNIEGWLHIVHDDFKQIMVDYLNNEVTKLHRPFDKEYKITNQLTQQIKWVHGLGQLEYGSASDLIGMLGTIQDITDRKLAELALQKSEEQFNQAMNASYEGLFDWNLQNNTIYYSPGWKRIVGYEDHELENRFETWEQLTDKNDVKLTIERFNNHLEGKTDRFESEFKMLHKQGHWINVLARGRASFNASGDPIRMVGTHIDITRQKNADALLESNNNALRKIIHATSSVTGQNYFDAMVVAIQQSTGATYTFIGESIGKNSITTIAVANKEKVIPNFIYELKDTPCENVFNKVSCIYPKGITKLFTKDQLLIDMGIEGYIGTPIFNHNNNCVGLVVNLYDKPIEGEQYVQSILEVFANNIGGEMERLKAEANLKLKNEELINTEEKLKATNDELTNMLNQLKESETRYKALHNASFGGIAIHDSGIILECNLGLSELTGYTYEELIGMNGLLLISDATRQLVVENIKQGYETPYEAIGVRKNGEEYPIRLEARNVPYKGKILRTVEFRDISERKKAERAILESEKRFRTIIESANDAIFIAETETGIFVDVNKKGEELIGRTKHEIIGMHQTQLHPKESLLKVKEEFNEDITKLNKPKVRETYVLHSSGTHIPTEVSPAVFKLDNNKEYIMGFFRDITKRKQAEKALEESLIKYKTLADFTYDWEYWKSPTGKYRYISPACQRITGYSVDEFEKNPDLFNTIIYNLDKPKWSGHLMDAENHIVCKTPLEFRIVTKSGDLKWLNHVCQPVYDEHKNFIGNRGTNRDITARKLTDQALIESESRFKQLADMTVEGIILHHNGIIRDVNKSLEKISGYSRQELLGKNLLELFIQPKDHASVAEKMKQDEVKPYELEVIKKGGQITPVEISAREMTRNNESIKFASVRDITEQKQLQQKILNAVIQTEENERLRVAQELHDGIGPLLSTVKLYTQSYISSNSDEFKKKIESQLVAGIDDALAHVSAISNKLSPHVLKDFGLKVAIEKFIGRIQKVSNITINYDFYYIGEIDSAIETTLYRVSIELINNTIKHAKATEINLTFENVHDFIQMVFTNNGKVFDLDNTKKSGSGMGLFNIENRIKSFNGQITFEKGAEQGIAYNILIPAILL